MKILVTGGTGYIGSHTVIELYKEGHEIFILDDLINSKITVLDKIEKISGKRPAFYQVDLLDYEKVEKVFQENDFDLVMHFAGLKAVGESVEKPLDYYENNLVGTINLLKCMKKFNVSKIIFSSSATVYGDPGNPKYVETMETGRNLANPYGKTKYMIEEILKDFSRSWKDLSVVILRYFNPIGNHESGLIGEDPNGIPNNLMPIIMKVARDELKCLSVYGDDYPTEDGTCKRDYIHVVDLAKGHTKALKPTEQPGVFIYNLGTGKPVSVLEVIKAFEETSGKKLPYEIVGRRAGDLAEFYADPTKAQNELGWKAELTIGNAMKDTLKFLEKRSEGDA